MRKKIWEKIKLFFKRKKKENKPIIIYKTPAKPEWINFGSLMIRERSLLRIEFFPSESDEIRYRVIIGYIDGGELNEFGIEFNHHYDFINFKENLIKSLGMLSFEFDDGVGEEMKIERFETTNEGKRIPIKSD